MRPCYKMQTGHVEELAGKWEWQQFEWQLQAETTPCTKFWVHKWTHLKTCEYPALAESL